MVPLYSILIRRDAHTTTPVTIPEYEVPVLQDIFGAENVHNAEGKRVDEAGCGPQAGTFDARGDEYDRLCAKYGVERMEQVFGKKGSAAFDKAISGASAKTAKSRQAAG